jgi:hypothetical protein
LAVSLSVMGMPADANRLAIRHTGNHAASQISRVFLAFTPVLRPELPKN